MQFLPFTKRLQVSLSGTGVERSLIRPHPLYVGVDEQVFLFSVSLALAVSTLREKRWVRPALTHLGETLVKGLLQKFEIAAHG